MNRPKQQILARHFVRFHMALIVAATTAAGAVAGKLLLDFGVEAPLLRYPLAVAIGYAAFLLLVRIWIFYVRGGTVHGDGVDVLPIDFGRRRSVDHPTPASRVATPAAPEPAVHGRRPPSPVRRPAAWILTWTTAG